MRFVETHIFTASVGRPSSRGKSGGIRVIYYWDRGRDVCYLLYLFAKNRRSDLSKRQLRELARTIAEEFG